MQDILSQIIANKRFEVDKQKTIIPIEALQDAAVASDRTCLSMRAALLASNIGIIAEFKRRSPSKGWIKQDADASVTPKGYANAGAAALSILTDENFFGGTLNDIKVARQHVTRTPILRKDFIIDKYQLLQARLAGADAILLIATCLTIEECATLIEKAHALQLEVLLEIHGERELPYASLPADMIGVNNRNLGSFYTDAQNSFRIADKLPASTCLVSESGLSKPETIKALREAGFRGFLMGEAFMKTADPAFSLQAFINAFTAQ